MVEVCASFEEISRKAHSVQYSAFETIFTCWECVEIEMKVLVEQEFIGSNLMYLVVQGAVGNI
jgi:hypothetical protein